MSLIKVRLNCFSPKLYLGLAPANSGGSVDVRGSGVGATSAAGATSVATSGAGAASGAASCAGVAGYFPIQLPALSRIPSITPPLAR